MSETVALNEPIADPFGNETTEVDSKHAKVAAAMDDTHPPTNPTVIIGALEYWADILGPNDPIVRSLSSWLTYLLNDDVSQFDAGNTCDQLEAVQNRLEELGIDD